MDSSWCAVENPQSCDYMKRLVRFQAKSFLCLSLVKHLVRLVGEARADLEYFVLQFSVKELPCAPTETKVALVDKLGLGSQNSRSRSRAAQDQALSRKLLHRSYDGLQAAPRQVGKFAVAGELRPLGQRALDNEIKYH
jgi:hypothetical protein